MSLKDSVTNPDVGSPRRIRKNALQTSEQYYLFLFTMITFPPFFFREVNLFSIERVSSFLSDPWNSWGGGGTPDFRWQGWSTGGKNQNPKKSLGLQTKPLKKTLDQNLTPKVSHAEFPSNKNSQKAFNDITQKIGTLIMECLCLFQSSQQVKCCYTHPYANPTRSQTKSEKRSLLRKANKNQYT